MTQEKATARGVNCPEMPERLLGAPLGQYHCPSCGMMVIAGLPHPEPDSDNPDYVLLKELEGRPFPVSREKATARRFGVSIHDNGYYCVSIPNYEGGDVVSAADYDALLGEVATLRAEALKGICVYCGYIEQYESLEQKTSEEGNAMRVAHIRQCEARPEAKLIAFSEQLVEEVAQLREALVQAALPYEVLLADVESRKWIAHEVWSAIEVAVTAARALLGKER